MPKPSVPRPAPMASLAANAQPKPTVHDNGQWLRRAVLLFVVFGTVGLLSYASWQHAAHASEPTTTAPAALP